MQTCWCQVEMSPCWPTPAAKPPAPDRRHDRHCHTTKSRRRAGWERPPASLLARSSGAPSHALTVWIVKPLKHFNEAVGHSLVDNLAVHQPQLHTYLGFDIGSELDHRIFF